MLAVTVAASRPPNGGDISRGGGRQQQLRNMADAKFDNDIVKLGHCPHLQGQRHCPCRCLHGQESVFAQQRSVGRGQWGGMRCPRTPSLGTTPVLLMRLWWPRGRTSDHPRLPNGSHADHTIGPALSKSRGPARTRAAAPLKRMLRRRAPEMKMRMDRWKRRMEK